MGTPTIRSIGIVNVVFGERVTVIEPANLYGCRFGDDCFVGPFVEVQRDVIIGNRCRIQSHAFICEMVTIGNDCFVSHGAKFVNDLFRTGGPAGRDKALWRETRVGNRVSIGTNATVLGVAVCDDVVIGAGSVVTRDIVEPGVYVGVPARRIRALDGRGEASR